MKNFLLSFLFFITPFIFSHELTGHASWYGGKFIGRLTANGEIFDTREFTAAHKTLPFNTVVEVTNNLNGKKTTVRINDRGPFIEGRIIDLSQIAAESIDMLTSGTADVTLKVVDMPPSPQVMDIQVAAYSNMIYASSMKTKLKQAGFEIKTSMNNEGITRVIIPNVPINSSYEIVKKLENMGIDKILIKYRG